MVTLSEIFERRMSTFTLEMVWNEEQDCILRALENTGEIISVAFGARQAAIAMAALRTLLADQPCHVEELRTGKGLDLDWRNVPYATENINRWPMFFEEIRVLLGFAALGIFVPWDLIGRESLSEEQERLIRLGDDIPAWIGDLTSRIQRVFDLAPEHDGAPYDRLYRIKHQASARLKYDQGGQLTPQELADLSGVSLKRIQNASYEGGEGAPAFDKKGNVTPDSAREWLARKSFTFSIWQEIAALAPLSSDWGRDVAVDPEAIINDGLDEEELEQEDDYLFVPVATDQSRFLPKLRRPNGYIIGPKDAQQYEPDYFKALANLARQSTPRWRRPNEAGNWGTVSARDWIRLSRSALEAQVKASA